MWPDRVSNPGPLTYDSGVLPTALHGSAREMNTCLPQVQAAFLIEMATKTDFTVAENAFEPTFCKITV